MPQTSLLDALDELATAIEHRNYHQINAAFDEYQAAYEEVAPTERVLEQRSELARTVVDLSSEERSKLANWGQQRIATSAGRMGVFSQGELFLFDPESADISEFAGSVHELRNRERALNDRTTTTAGILSNIQLPAHVDILSVDAGPPTPVVGTSTSVVVSITNVGATPAEGVSLGVASDLPVSPTDTTLGSVAGGETETVTVEVTVTESGRHNVTFTAESADAGNDSEIVTITGTPKREIIEVATNLVADLIERFEKISSLPGHKERSFIAKLQSTQRSIDRAQKALDQEKQKQATNAFNTAINQMGAFLNELATIKQKKSSLSDVLIWSLKQSARVVIDQLARVRESVTDN